MAWIQYHKSDERQIENEYRLWRIAQPREPGQLGSAIFMDVTGAQVGFLVERAYPDGFVDALEDSTISFKRLTTV